MTLGTKLRNLRTDKGISMEEFATQIDISKTAVVKWEADKAKPSLDNIIKICNFYRIDIYELLENVSNVVISHNKFRDGNYVAHANNVTVNNYTPTEIIQSILET
ncbi:helix-turn-helix domain-containing protein [Chryseobacterium lacus]|uniref:helix-turn-helix domain-containing protein n=1 Tax=Chryseobacterium lacus TaxID=2058346 RepID=UPI000F8639CE|nr:helix-turn-helix transcriptional regulator [Chryseobacterium lacus]RST27566.1 XRE family transcriptional regulator [Chryseobacterium lacus]